MGVRKREGILGTDIFYRLGFLMAAAARPGEIGLITVIGLMTVPLGLALAPLGESNCEATGSYSAGPGKWGSGSRSAAIEVSFFLRA